MDELIRKYAEILKNAKVGDYTYEGILASFTREIEASGALVKPAVPQYGRGSNTGHGYVWPRPDGYKARCGGISRCVECARDGRQIGMIGRDSS